jgi:hypothetical protein
MLLKSLCNPIPTGRFLKGLGVLSGSAFSPVSYVPVPIGVVSVFDSEPVSELVGAEPPALGSEPLPSFGSGTSMPEPSSYSSPLLITALFLARVALSIATTQLPLASLVKGFPFSSYNTAPLTGLR